MQLIFRRLYCTKAANDKCTLFADRNLINRRNVSADTEHAYSQNKQMLIVALKARVVVAGMNVLGLSEIDGKPTGSTYPSNTSRNDPEEKQRYIRKIASAIVDEILSSVLLREDQAKAAKNRNATPNGRFQCRFPGCEKTYKYNS